VLTERRGRSPHPVRLVVDQHRFADVGERAGVGMLALDEDAPGRDLGIRRQRPDALVGGAERDVVVDGELHPLRLCPSPEDLLELTA
jgi:hypothetical protein